MKICNKCLKIKPFTEFYVGSAYKDGYRPTCKACVSLYYKKRNATADQKAKNREWSIKRKYQISQEDYDSLLITQSDACKICGSTSSRRGDQPLVVDHCHQTGEVRGLLCHPCNVAIGLLGENISTLQSAINYLSTYH